MALMLAAIGIYGVMTYSVLQRTQELAIRLALGATRWNVIGRVVGHGIFLALCGITIGSVGALGFVRTLRSMLFDVSPSDPAIFSGVALLLFAVAVTASYIPAVRAARKDPLGHCGANELTFVAANWTTGSFKDSAWIYFALRWPQKVDQDPRLTPNRRSAH